jgi:hypothetical protein
MIRPQAFGLDNKGRWRWFLEATGAVAVTPSYASGPQSPALFPATARYTVDHVSAFAGVELPLNDAVGIPAVRPVLGIGWAPRFEDADEDGIGDDDDECPELAEDKDGFEDNDGCPDFDNDDDGVSDEDDRCPKELEDADEFQDEDGCPDPDNAGDTIPDVDDGCPGEAGPKTGGPKPGCPIVDSDKDGVLDSVDRCPSEPEDLDAFEDDDGCPDPDTDGDGVADVEDECRDQAGQARPETQWHGCPSPDHDGDTFDDQEDQCADEPEDFDGVKDDDGCADPEPGRALVTLDTRGAEPFLKLSAPLRFKGDAVDPISDATLRAVAQILNAHDDWIVAVGVRSTGPSAEAAQEALNRSFSVTLALRAYTHRDSAAESLSFSAVEKEPLARQSGVGLLLLVPRPAETPPASPP